MSERDIQESLKILHDTQELVSNSYWRATSLEEPSFLEDMEKIQRAMFNIKGNFMSFIFDRKNVIELSEWLHESYLKNNEYIHCCPIFSTYTTQVKQQHKTNKTPKDINPTEQA